MTSHIWIGGAPKVAQVNTITLPSDIVAGQTVIFNIGNKSLSVLLEGTSLTAIVAELVAAWNASTEPEYAEVTAAAGTTDGAITLTSDTAGKPFIVTTTLGTGTNEIQIVTITGATGGTFTLSFGGYTTSALAYNASAATVQTAFTGLTSVGSGNATVTGDDGGPYTIEFTGTLANTDVAKITYNASSLTGQANEVQTISMVNTPTGGTFRLTYDEETTDTIDYNASAATIQTKLLALTNIPSGGVSCSGGPLPGTPVVVTFQGALSYTDVPLMTANSDALTGINASVTTDTEGGNSLRNKVVHYYKFEENPSTDAFSGDTIYAIDSLESGTTNDKLYEEPTDSSNRLSYSTAGGILGGCIANTSGHDVCMRSVSGVAEYDETTAFSLSIWVKPTGSFSSEQDLIIMGPGSIKDYGLYIDSSGYPVFKRKNSSGFHTATGTTALTLNSWNLIVAVYDPDNTKIQVSVNGAAFDETTGLTIGTEAIFPSSQLYVMTRGVSRNYRGYIDSIGIYNQALSAAEASDLYNSGLGNDYPFPSGSGANEVQTISFTGTPTAGTIDLIFGGSTITANYDSTAAELQDLLDAADSIGPGNSSATGGPWPGTGISIEFIGDLGVTNVEEITLDVSGILTQVAETTKGVAEPTIGVTVSATPVSSSTTTANSGPNNWDVAANWNTNSVPTTGDIAYVSDSNVDILYGLDQSAVTLAELHIEQTFTGSIGLPRKNTDGTTSYYEYREQYLKIGATELYIGEKNGDGSDRIKINLGSVQTTALITNSGSSPDGNTPPILLLGSHASNVINVNRGFVGIAYFPTETATVATIRQAFIDDATDDTTVFCGSGATLTNITKTGGTLDINSATTSFQQTAGTTTVHDGAHTVLNVLAGTLNYNSTGTLAAANLSGDAVLIFDQDARPKDVTVINKYGDDSEIYDESGSIASPVIQLHNCGDMSTLHMGKDFKLTFSATT